MAQAKLAVLKQCANHFHIWRECKISCTSVRRLEDIVTNSDEGSNWSRRSQAKYEGFRC